MLVKVNLSLGWILKLPERIKITNWSETLIIFSGLTKESLM